MQDRRDFIKKVGLLSALTSVAIPGGAASFNTSDIKNPGLRSLDPQSLFDVLDLSAPGLKNVETALRKTDTGEAMKELLKHYRAKYPRAVVSEEDEVVDKDAVISRADDVTRNKFQWGPVPAVDYGKDINWSADAGKDIEWVASILRFAWVGDLVKAYEITKDEKYAEHFVRLVSDWIGKHPIEKTIDLVHPVYTYWKGYVWLDLQTGIRATNLCSGFRTFVNSPAFTPEFLGKLMASLYDHQQKTLHMPMNKIHNKAVFEQRGFVNVIHTFPEFRDKDLWLESALRIVTENLMAQTTTDGVQREWAGGYHYGVYRDFMEIASRYDDFGVPVPANYMDRVRKMADYMFYIATPELGFPMFGNTSRDKSLKRRQSGLYKAFKEASQRFGDNKYKDLAEGNWNRLPVNGSAEFKRGGFYVFRNNWTEQQVYMALHCSPPGLNPFHDHQDNGAFELYAYGKWLMPDTGFYLYGRSTGPREWHRETCRHPTLTVNRKDTDRAAQFLCWQSSEEQDLLGIENKSYYPTMLHRRTVWMCNKKADPFFVLLDEAIGDASGDIEIHFPLAPGEVRVDDVKGSFHTLFNEVNLVGQVYGQKKIELTQEQGWTSYKYGLRDERVSVSAKYKGSGPFAFLSILAPYKGAAKPECKLLTDLSTLIAGADPIRISVEVGGKRYELERRIE